MNEYIKVILFLQLIFADYSNKPNKCIYNQCKVIKIVLITIKII